MSDRAELTRLPMRLKMPAPGFLRSISRWPVRRDANRETGAAERILRDDAQVQRQRRERSNVVVLDVRRKHVALRRIEPIDPTPARVRGRYKRAVPGARARWPKSGGSNSVDTSDAVPRRW